MPDGRPRSEGRACFPTGARHTHRRIPRDSTLVCPATVRHRTSQPVRPPLSDFRHRTSAIRRPPQTGNAEPEGPAFPYAVRRERRPVAATAPAAVRFRVGTRLPGRVRPDNGAFHTVVECGSGSVRAVLFRLASDLQGIGRFLGPPRNRDRSPIRRSTVLASPSLCEINMQQSEHAHHRGIPHPASAVSPSVSPRCRTAA